MKENQHRPTPSCCDIRTGVSSHKESLQKDMYFPPPRLAWIGLCRGWRDKAAIRFFQFWPQACFTNQYMPLGLACRITSHAQQWITDTLSPKRCSDRHGSLCELAWVSSNKKMQQEVALWSGGERELLKAACKDLHFANTTVRDDIWMAVLWRVPLPVGSKTV